MTITLYAGGSPNVHKVEIMLHEVELDFELRVVDIYNGENFSDWFTAVNPTQKIPMITDTEGPGGEKITVFDSGAILIYLAEKTGRLLPTNGPARTTTLQWLMFQMSAVGPILGQLTRFTFHDDLAAESTAQRRFISLARRVFDTLDDRLSVARYLGGEDYGIADIATYAWLRLVPSRLGDVYPVLAPGWPVFPSIRRWIEDIAVRPAVQRALSLADSRSYAPEKAPSENIDKLFDRGRSARSLVME
jgi:GSH-dependent disulfide-bond oxidoreductase